MTIPTAEQLPETITIGVLALQGAFIEHIHFLQRLRPSGHNINAIPVRCEAELNQCHALVIPGGESTVMHSVAERSGFLPALLKFVQDPNRAVYGTCAGMILMACEDGIGGGKIIKGRPGAKGWGGMEGLKVWRNLYGTQLESFEAHMQIPCLTNPSKPFNAIFIRAPAVHSIPAPSTSSPNSSNSSIEVLATLPAEATPDLPPSDTPLGPANPDDLGKIMLRQGRKLVTSFHPELSGDVRIHEYWVERCVLGR